MVIGETGLHAKRLQCVPRESDDTSACECCPIQTFIKWIILYSLKEVICAVPRAWINCMNTVACLQSMKVTALVSWVVILGQNKVAFVNY